MENGLVLTETQLYKQNPSQMILEHDNARPDIAIITKAAIQAMPSFVVLSISFTYNVVPQKMSFLANFSLLNLRIPFGIKQLPDH